MKKMISILAAVVVGFLAQGIACAATGSQTVVSSPALAYSTQTPVNLNGFNLPQTGAAKISAQVVYASATIPTQTFITGTQSTGSITVLSNNILSAAATNRITVPATSAILAQPATAQITVSSGVTGSTIYVNGNTLIEGIHWTKGATTTTAATAIAGAINTYIGAMTASSAGNVVYATATVSGALGNSYTVGSSSSPAYSTTTFSGGSDRSLSNAVITFNGEAQREGYAWNDDSNTSTGTAVSIAAWLNSYTNQIRASATGSVVYATATTNGGAANAFTLTSSVAKLVVLTPTFTGGQDAAFVTVNGKTFTAGVDFSTGTTAQTATFLATAINSASATTLVNSAAAGTLVTSTSTAVGLATKYALATSSPTALSISGATMTGGRDSASTINSATLNIPAHGFTTTLPVLLSTGANVLTGLTNQTTYFVVVVDANNIKLSSTSLVAQTGNGIVITSSNTQTAALTATLAPLPFIQGPAAGKWEVSNDNVNWATYSANAYGVAVASQTFAPVFPSSNTVQDFGYVDFGYMRYNVTAPTQGGVNLKVILNAKD